VLRQRFRASRTVIFDDLPAAPASGLSPRAIGAYTRTRDEFHLPSSKPGTCLEHRSDCSRSESIGLDDAALCHPVLAVELGQLHLIE
jgi:hypothetical protein